MRLLPIRKRRKREVFIFLKKKNTKAGKKGFFNKKKSDKNDKVKILKSD